MIETDRRGFLKGLLAIMAVAAMPAPAIAAIEVLPKPGLPDVEAGEIWLFIKNEWRLVGASISFRYRGERDAVSQNLSGEVKADIIADDDGTQILWDTVMSGNVTQAAFGVAMNNRMVFDTILVGCEERASRGNANMLGVQFILNGEPVV